MRVRVGGWYVTFLIDLDGDEPKNHRIDCQKIWPPSLFSKTPLQVSQKRFHSVKRKEFDKSRCSIKGVRVT